MMTQLRHWLQTEGPDIGLLVARIIMGVFWLGQFVWKAPPDFGCPNGGLCQYVQKEIDQPLFGFYGTILANIVAPNIYLFGWCITIVETLIGLSLLLGVFTRLGGLVSMLWSLNLLIGLAAVPNEYPPAYLIMALTGFLFLMMGAGKYLSLDRRLGIDTPVPERTLERTRPVPRNARPGM